VLASPKLVASIGGTSGLVSLLVGKSAKTPGAERKADQKGPLTILMEQSLSIIALLFVALLIVILSFVSSLLIQRIGLIDYNKDIARSAFIRKISPATDEAVFTDVMHDEQRGDAANASPGQEPRRVYEFDPWNRSILAPVIGDEYGDLNLMKVMYYPPYWFIGAIALLLFGFGMAVSRWVINLNKFSLHAGYRNRIIRAFLGASRTTGERRPNPFTGFDPSDNIQMHELRPNLLRERSFRESDETKSSGLVRLIVKLRDAKDDKPSIDTDVAAYLRGKLSKETLEMLRNHRGYNEPSQSLKKRLIEDLNLCLEEENFYGAPAFTRARESSRTQDFLNKITQESIYGDYLIYLNRLLLLQAFPDDFADWKYPPPPYRLLHIVNTTLNLVGGDNLAWQQRKAEAFSVSPLHCGSLFVGYRRSKDYGGEDGISLGTAVAISGAAVSSNMGYLSTSSALTFVLTFFNARLGWWLGNPGPAGDEFYDKAHPRQAIYPLLAEAFGLTDDKNAYVLLSDGGQFENLGLYEMVLRRNRFIVLVDGGADSQGSFEDLGNAVRKIRIDMGIEIDFDEMKIYPRSITDKTDGLYCAIGTIHYGMVDKDAGEKPGVLVYIKPAYYGNEPRDVYNYGQSNKEFPHESTADQFFDEPQFESHRRLGAYIVDLMVGEDWTGASLDEFRAQIDTHYLKRRNFPVDLPE
ncbi:MAG TPA: hypothetical protein VKC34_01080, partial [Blastocatellia bacterium]|nr:hypothetical protein [Blastocatellia bacterium]